MHLFVVLLVVVVLAVLFVALVLFSQQQQKPSDVCGLYSLWNCSASQYNSICSAYIDTPMNPECASYCDSLAATASNQTMRDHQYCMRIERYRYMSTCAKYETFNSAECLEEMPYYCYRTAMGFSPCDEHCANAYKELTEAYVTQSTRAWSTLCENPFCTGLRNAQYDSLCQNICVRQGLSSSCKANETDYRFYCNLHQAQYLCENANVVE